MQYTKSERVGRFVFLVFILILPSFFVKAVTPAKASSSSVAYAQSPSLPAALSTSAAASPSPSPTTPPPPPPPPPPKPNPLARYGHCSVTYKNILYIFGGWDNGTDANGLNITPFFYSHPLPLNVNQLNWTSINTGNATNVGLAACVAAPSGYMLIFGGVTSLQSNDKVPSQVFDLNRNLWVDPELLLGNMYPGFGVNPRAELISPDFVAVYAGDTGVDVLPGKLPVQYVYFLNMASVPWTWTQARKNDSIDAPVSRIFGTAKGNLWSFGGYFPTPAGNYSTKMFITNRQNQWVSPDLFLPYGIREGAVGVKEDIMFVITFANSSLYPVNVFPLNMSSMQYEQNILFLNMHGRTSASYSQIDGSDAVVIYGGCPQDYSQSCNTPLDSMLIFNMTTRNFTDDLNIVSNIAVDNFTLPQIGGFDLNADNEDPSNPDPNGGNNSSRPTWLVIFISVMVTFAVCSIIFVATWKIMRRRLQVQKTSFEITTPLSKYSPYTAKGTFSQTPGNSAFERNSNSAGVTEGEYSPTTTNPPLYDASDFVRRPPQIYEMGEKTDLVV